MTRRRTTWISVLMLLALVAAACGSDNGGGGGEAQEGGSVVFAAEQWPECTNPVTSCYNTSWLSWTVFTHVLPQLMTLDPDGNYTPSPVLDGEPEAVTNDDGTFSVTYQIAEDAVWNDGTPMTSADLEWTRMAHLDTAGSLLTTGYDQITSIDTTEAKTAVVNFDEPYAPWRNLWGGIDYLLKADSNDSTDISEVWLDNLPFSGGPWVLQSWSDQEAVLVRNDAFWDADMMPILDQVTFIPREDVDTQVTALEGQDPAGQVAAIFPQPGPGLTDRLTDPISYEVGGSAFIEGLWFNLGKPPFDDLAAREAFAFAIDREEIGTSALADVFPGLLQCAGWVPASPWCDATDFADVTQDQDKAAQILTDDGWAKNASGVWEKDGEEFDVLWRTVDGNTRREGVQALVADQLSDFGIKITIDNKDAGTLFNDLLPVGDFELSIYAQGSDPDPDVAALYTCDQVPSEANQFGGQNFSQYCNPDVDALSAESNMTTDLDARLDIVQQIGDQIRADMVWVPLYNLPNVIAWRTDIIGGPITTFKASALGGFANMYDWYLVS